MKSEKSLFKVLSLSFAISGAVLTLPGVGLFVAGGVGTQSLSAKQGKDSPNKLLSSGYFNQSANFTAITSEGGKWKFTEEIAKSNNVNYDIFGFIDFYLSGVDVTSNNPNADPSMFNFTTEQEMKNYLNGIKVDNALFITGAVLWPIGVVLLLLAMTFFIILKVKNKK